MQQQTTWLVYSVNETGAEIFEQECVSFDDAVEHANAFLCPVVIYAKIPATQFAHTHIR